MLYATCFQELPLLSDIEWVQRFILFQDYHGISSATLPGLFKIHHVLGMKRSGLLRIH